MARTWLSIRVELVSGHGADLWPRPGRVFAAARSHSFAQLASAIDLAFGRWDLAHLHLFTLSDGTHASLLDWWDGEAPEDTVDGHTTKLSRLQAGEQFAYVFDMGDDWAHLCTVGERHIDPFDEFGETPDRPVPYWGWGSLPDQYARRWDGTMGSRRCRSGRPAGSATCLRSCRGGANTAENDLTLCTRGGRQRGVEVLSRSGRMAR